MRRRGYMLIEMLVVLIAVAVGGSLMTIGIVAIRRSQDRVAELANRTAQMNDFVRCLRRDVRAATTARLRTADEEASTSVLQLDGGSKPIIYRFCVSRVERVGTRDGTVAAKVWHPMTATVSVTGADGAAGAPIVIATVFWERVKEGLPQPDRRFDVALRCAGELTDETE